jgi:tetratricopeptide (TPR) repeat protein
MRRDGSVAFWRRRADGTGLNQRTKRTSNESAIELSVAVARDAYQTGTLTAAQYEHHLRQVTATGDPRSVGFAAAHLAIMLGDQGRELDAEHWYREAIRGGCEEVRAPAATNLAVLLVGRGRLAEAEALLRHVMGLSDVQAAAMAAHNLGGLLADQGRTIEALNVLRVAVDSGHPDESVGALLLIGRIRMRQRQQDGARQAFEQVAASMHPRYARQAYEYLTELGRGY